MLLKILLKLICGLLIADIALPAELNWTTRQEGQIRLADLTGKIVVLELIYSTCKPCLSSSQRLATLAKQYADRGVKAYTIAFDPNAAYVLGNGTGDMTPIGWADGAQVRTLLGWKAGETGPVPQIVVVDQTGKIRFQTGMASDDPLREDPNLRVKIDGLLAETAHSK